MIFPDLFADKVSDIGAHPRGPNRHHFPDPRHRSNDALALMLLRLRIRHWLGRNTPGRSKGTSLTNILTSRNQSASVLIFSCELTDCVNSEQITIYNGSLFLKFPTTTILEFFSRIGRFWIFEIPYSVNSKFQNIPILEKNSRIAYSGNFRNNICDFFLQRDIRSDGQSFTQKTVALSGTWSLANLAGT